MTQNLAQAQADAIRRRRQVVADLRLIAGLVADGLPSPIGIHPDRLDGTRVQIRDDDLADWLLYFDEPMPVWTADSFSDGEHTAVKVDHGLTLVAFRRSTTEVTC